MATTGSVDVNLTSYGNMVNNASDLGAEVTGGIADQGEVIGMSIGIVIFIMFLFGVAILGFSLCKKVINLTDKIKED